MNPKAQRTILRQSRIFGYASAALSIPFAVLGGLMASCCPFGVLVGAMPLLITSGIGAQLAAIFLDYSVVSKRDSTGAGLRVGVRSATIAALAGGIFTLFTASQSLSALTAASGAGDPEGGGVLAAITIGLMNLLMLLLVVACCAVLAIVPGVIGAFLRGSAARDSEPEPEPGWETELKSVNKSSLIEWGILLGLLAAAALIIPVIQQYSMGKSQPQQQRVADQNITVGSADLDLNSGGEEKIDPLPESVAEALATLISEKAVFTFTNVGGGIKHVEFTETVASGGEKHSVRANRFGIAPIGALINADGKFENVIHYYMNAQSTDRSIVLMSKLQSDLIVKKTFTLSGFGQSGGTYLIDLTLMIENASDSEQNLAQWSLFVGDASPLSPSEKAEHTGFLSGGGGSNHFRSSISFGRGLAGQDQIFFNPSDALSEYAGVSNQLFMTVIRAQESSRGRSWARQGIVMLPNSNHRATSVSAGLGLPAVTLAPRANTTLKYQIYAGPKIREIVDAMGEGWQAILNNSDPKPVD